MDHGPTLLYDGGFLCICTCNMSIPMVAPYQRIPPADPAALHRPRRLPVRDVVLSGESFVDHGVSSFWLACAQRPPVLLATAEPSVGRRLRQMGFGRLFGAPVWRDWGTGFWSSSEYHVVSTLVCGFVWMIF